jgi:hypothetical protein
MHTIDKTGASLTLLGKVISQSVTDALTPGIYQDEARDFIFSDRLPDFLKRFHIDGLVNAEYIRKQVKGNNRTFFLHEEHFTGEEELPGKEYIA